MLGWHTYLVVFPCPIWVFLNCRRSHCTLRPRTSDRYARQAVIFSAEFFYGRPHLFDFVVPSAGEPLYRSIHGVYGLKNVVRAEGQRKIKDEKWLIRNNSILKYTYTTYMGFYLSFGARWKSVPSPSGKCFPPEIHVYNNRAI